MEISTQTEGPVQIRNGSDLWNHCQEIEHVTIEVREPNIDFLQSLVNKETKTLTLKNLLIAEGKLPNDIFKGKEKIILRDCYFLVAEHLITHCCEGNREIDTDLILTQKRDLTRMINIQSLKTVVFRMEINEESHYNNLSDILRQLALQKNIIFKIHLKIDCRPGLNEYMRYQLNQYQARYENIRINFI